MVQDFIYQLNNIFHQKELRLVQDSEFKMHDSDNQVVDDLLTNFGKTQLTSEEAMINSQDKIENDKQIIVLMKLNTIQINLDRLAKIQLEESNQLTQRSKKSLDINILMSKLELAFMLIIGSAFLILIFQPRSCKPSRSAILNIEY